MCYVLCKTYHYRDICPTCAAPDLVKRTLTWVATQMRQYNASGDYTGPASTLTLTQEQFTAFANEQLHQDKAIADKAFPKLKVRDCSGGGARGKGPRSADAEKVVRREGVKVSGYREAGVKEMVCVRVCVSCPQRPGAVICCVQFALCDRMPCVSADKEGWAGVGGEGGIWNTKICGPKMAQINISFCKFHFRPPMKSGPGEGPGVEAE